MIPSLNFPESGLIAAIAQDASSGEVLMLAWMNEEALTKTLETGEVHYYSRSRQELWHKGATSGHIQTLVELRYDCDKDAVLLQVNQKGAACHTHRRSCFYHSVRDGKIMINSEPLK